MAGPRPQLGTGSHSGHKAAQEPRHTHDMSDKISPVGTWDKGFTPGLGLQSNFWQTERWTDHGDRHTEKGKVRAVTDSRTTSLLSFLLNIQAPPSHPPHLPIFSPPTPTILSKLTPLSLQKEDPGILFLIAPPPPS